MHVSSVGMGGGGEYSAHYRLENPPHRKVLRTRENKVAPCPVFGHDELRALSVCISFALASFLNLHRSKLRNLAWPTRLCGLIFFPLLTTS